MGNNTQPQQQQGPGLISGPLPPPQSQAQQQQVQSLQQQHAQQHAQAQQLGSMAGLQQQGGASGVQGSQGGQAQNNGPGGPILNVSWARDYEFAIRRVREVGGMWRCLWMLAQAGMESGLG